MKQRTLIEVENGVVVHEVEIFCDDDTEINLDIPTVGRRIDVTGNATAGPYIGMRYNEVNGTFSSSEGEG